MTNNSSPQKKVPERIATRLKTLAKDVRQRLKTVPERTMAEKHDCEEAKKSIMYQPSKDTFVFDFSRTRSLIKFEDDFAKVGWVQVKMDPPVMNVYNNKTLPYLREHGLLQDLKKIDQSWITAQSKYYESLPLYDLITVKNYTYHGDKLANALMRNQFDESQLNIMEAVEALSPQVMTHIHTIRKSEYSGMKDNILMKDVINKSKRLADGDPKVDKSNLHLSVMRIRHHIKPSFIKRMIRLFIRDLQRIIMNAPPMPTESLLFRGVKSPFYQLKSRKGRYENEGFVSTSFRIEEAAEFLEDKPSYDEDFSFDIYDDPLSSSSSSPLSSSSSSGGYKQPPICCMQRIRVLPNTHALILFPVSQYPHECEVLLPVGTTFVLHNGRKTLYRQTNQHDVCMSSGFHIQVTEATVGTAIRTAAMPKSVSAASSQSLASATSKSQSKSKSKPSSKQ